MIDRVIQRRFGWAAVAALAATLAVAAYWLLFTAFMLYDDEGFVLISLKSFSEHGHLYDQVYTQYGPLPYLLYDALHRVLGFEFNNISGRWITAVNWLGTCAFSAIAVGRVTRSPLWSGFTFAGVFTYLWVMISEPVHPGGIIALVVAGSAWLGSEAATRRQPIGFAVLAGGAAACLALTKINVGAFLFAAAAVWLALHTAGDKSRRLLVWGAALGCTLLPFALMRSLFAAAWVREYGLIFIGASLSLLLAGPRSAGFFVKRSTWIAFLATLGTLIGLVLTLTLLRGSTVTRIIDGVLLDPLRHPGVYFFAMHWRIGAGVIAVASLGIAAWTARTKAWDRPTIRACVALLRLAACVGFFAAPLGLISATMPGWGMSYGVALAWLFVVPLRDDRDGEPTRRWIALLLVFQFLHAYPIAGSQMNWGTFLWVPLLALGMHDAAPVLLAWVAPARRLAQVAAVASVIGVTLFMSGRLVSLGWERYTTSQPLRLPGAESLRMPNELTFAMRIMQENLSTHGDVLFSVPGLYSANLWTGLPTPTLANATHWFTLLSDAQQQEIQTELAKASRPVLLVQRPLVDYLVTGGFARSGPLVKWIRENFTPAFAVYPYEIWVRRGRAIAALSTARVEPQRDGGPAHLVLTVGRTRGPVATVEMIADPDSRTAPLALPAAHARVRRLTPAGEAVAPERPFAAPMELPPLTELTLDVPADVADRITRRTLFVLRDPSGRPVGELRSLTGDAPPPTPAPAP